MNQKIFQNRRLLNRTWECIRTGKISIGFIGGSVTDGRPRNNWPEPVVSWFIEKFPDVDIYVENAAIGATGSDLAVFRAERDLIQRGCDLVFIDYAGNDAWTESNLRKKSREGLVRKLLTGSECDIVFVYIYFQEWYEIMMQGGVPDSIAEFEELAEHYGIGSVWMGLHALNELRKGRMRWEEWFYDGVHPSKLASLISAQSVILFLEEEWNRYAAKKDKPILRTFPDPLHPANWEFTSFITFDEVHKEGPWVVYRWPFVEWIDQVLETAAVGSRLSFSFRGRGLALGFDYGKNSAEFRYKLDGEDWAASARVRPEWLPADGLFSLHLISDELSDGDHRIELEVVHGLGKDCKGTNFRLAFIGVIH